MPTASSRQFSAACLALTMLGALACSGKAESDGAAAGGVTAAGAAGQPGAPGASGGAPGAMPASGASGRGITLSSGGTGGVGVPVGAGGFDGEDACVGISTEGERLPLDLYFMVDTTGSMNCPVPDSASNPCWLDPGPPYSDVTRWVVEGAALKSFMTSEENAGIGVGIGFFPKRRNMCSADSYVEPTVAIAELPGAANFLSAAVSAQRPGGNTPTVASLTGALRYATNWAATHQDRRVAVVYATDGYPVDCGPGNSIAAAAQAADDAFTRHGIRTYVLALGRNLSDLNRIAMAGNTDTAYLVDTVSGDAAAQLSKALNDIRGQAINYCTYEIPRPADGEMLEPGKVNVRFTESSGNVIDALLDPSPSCSDGWQYSEDGKAINLCGQLCETVKADPDGTMEILFGCTTNTVPH